MRQPKPPLQKCRCLSRRGSLFPGGPLVLDVPDACVLPVQALAAGKKELLSHLKKVKKAQAAIRVEAAAFSAMVSNDGGSLSGRGGDFAVFGWLR